MSEKESIEFILNKLMEYYPEIVVDWMKSVIDDYICPDCER